MNGISRINDQNLKAQLAAQFNDFYLQTTSSSINQIGNYKVIEEIGEGAFGKVYLANHILLNVNVVLKCGLIDDPNIVREIYYHRQLKHKNIVKLYEIIKTENHLWLALEYCQGNELFYYIYEQRHLNIDTVKKLFIQILNGIKYVHSLNLSHRDLKLENILLADKQKTIVKLTDFGFVREFNPLKRQFLSTICGTTVYMAPELLKNEKYSGFSIDIWSLGIILFTMLYGEMPFDEDDDLKTKYKIIHDDPVYKEIIPPDAINLLKKILCKDPYKRPTLNEIINHPFLSVIQPIEKSRRSSLYNDSESIISINQYYNTNKIPFQSKIERHLLKKLEKLNINIDFLQQSVLNDETNSITAFYDLCLTQEFNKKKKRYLKEKKLRYYEAKKSLKKSRKKVKSALSLNDQNNNQPLERIISSLSLTSTKNHDQNTPSSNMISSPQSIDDQIKLKEKRRRSASASIINSNSFANYQNKDLKSENNPPQINIEPSNERVISFHQDDDEKRRPSNVTALSSIVSENKKKRTKNNNILNKLQFWKRNRRNTIHNFDGENNLPIDQNHLPITSYSLNPSLNEKSSNNSKNSLIQNKKSMESFDDNEEPLEINIKPKNSPPNSSENRKKLSSPSIIKPENKNSSSNDLFDDDTFTKPNKDSSSSLQNGHDSPSSPIPIIETNVNGNQNTVIESSPHDTTIDIKDDITPDLNDTINDNDLMVNTNTNNTSALEFQSNSSDSPKIQSPPNLESYYISSGNRQMRTRPSSVVSQASQISQFSQLSTMLSESELDILDETDTMDEEFDDDEAAYESSLNISQNDFAQHQRQLSASMTPTSSMNITNNNKANIKKRPSYNRQLSSDISIVSTSTTATGQLQNGKSNLHSKKISLSQVSSNSSEESLITNNNSAPNGFFLNSTPMIPLPRNSNDLDSTLLPRSSSPELTRNGISNGGSKNLNQSPFPQTKSRINRSISPNNSNSGSPKSSKSKSSLAKQVATRNFPYPFSNSFNGKSNNNSSNSSINANNSDGKNNNVIGGALIRRSHSPPLPNKFNKLKTNRNIMKNLNIGATIDENQISSSNPAAFKPSSNSDWQDKFNGTTNTEADEKFPLWTHGNFNSNATSFGFGQPSHSNHPARFKSGINDINEEEEDEES